MLNHLPATVEGFYPVPDGLARRARRRLLLWLGVDPLPLRRRAELLGREAADWKRGCVEAEADALELLFLAEAAWGLIANAHGGDWERATPEWREAAERWRERWHAALDANIGPEGVLRRSTEADLRP